MVQHPSSSDFYGRYRVVGFGWGDRSLCGAFEKGVPSCDCGGNFCGGGSFCDPPGGKLPVAE